jgi:UDP-N-acetylglucosamine 1-carboxyvinyltransferase
MARLLLDLGAEVEGIGSTTLRIRCVEVTKDEPDSALVGRLRGSVLLLGPLMARRGRAIVAPPGGDFPARRTITTHIGALMAMGARRVEGSGHRLEAPGGLKSASIYLDEASVTGTETAMLAAAAASGVTEIRHAACEPHVVELGEFLRAMGAGVTGEGTHTIRIEGVNKLNGAEKTLYGDYIEAGSWAVTGAITGGHMEIGGTRPVDMEVVASVLNKMHVNCVQDNDVVSLVTVLATQADGATLVHDWLYELRLFALEQMSGMGADLFLCDPHRIIVTGPRKLRGKSLDSRDIRSGMALIAAALAADGQSRVEPLETVERGYSRLVERLQKLGASVAKV